jgi:hypothetical protein
MKKRVRSIQSNRLVDRGDGIAVLSSLMGDETEQVQGIRAARVGVQNPAIELLGLGELTGLVELESGG